MTDLFEASIAAAGRDLERAVARDGSRGVGIAMRRAGGARELVCVVGPGIAERALDERPGWDLPLVTAREIETSSGPRTFVAELLPVGVPSTWLAGPGAQRSLLPFTLELAGRVAAEHARGAVVGLLHPATVLVEPEHGRLIAVAQRPLRIAGTIGVEGDRPLLGYRAWTPRDLTGEAADAPDDVFRLALLAWHWRHGGHPFGSLSDGELLGVLGEVTAGEPPPLPAAEDDLDAVLLSCFVPRAAARPSAADLVTALEASA